jgi:hypothetical protein
VGILQQCLCIHCFSKLVGDDPSLKMIVYFAFPLLLMASFSTAFLLSNESECPSEALRDLTDILSQDSKISWPRVINGVSYSEDAIRFDKGRILGCPCKTINCLPLCCDVVNCIKYLDPGMHLRDLLPVDFQSPLINVRFDKFLQFSWDPCHRHDGYELEHNEFVILANGSLYQHSLGYAQNYVDFCVRKRNDTYTVMVCFDEMTSSLQEGVNPVFPITMLISVPFLIVTFAVYIFIPELRNLHGQTLCAYIFSLIIAYTALATLQIIEQDIISNFICFSFGNYFYFLLQFSCLIIYNIFGIYMVLYYLCLKIENERIIVLIKNKIQN